MPRAAPECRQHGRGAGQDTVSRVLSAGSAPTTTRIDAAFAIASISEVKASGAILADTMFIVLLVTGNDLVSDPA